MPSDAALKAMNLVHRVIIGISRGRFGWTAFGMPVIELTTTGRTSGQPRTVILTSPVQEGTTLVVVASRGGDDRSPAWYLNLRADPHVQVSRGGGAARPLIARTATAAERERLWPMVVSRFAQYGEYQKRTEREIPLVLLDPE